MRMSYKKLWLLLVEKEISPATLRKDLNIASGTMTKMRRNEEVALSVLLRICEYLDCNIGDICDAIKTDNLISIFSRRQVCKTDLQKTPIYSGYKCSLYEKPDTKFSECIECPLIRKERL